MAVIDDRLLVLILIRRRRKAAMEAAIKYIKRFWVRVFFVLSLYSRVCVFHNPGYIFTSFISSVPTNQFAVRHLQMMLS